MIVWPTFAEFRMANYRIFVLYSQLDCIGLFSEYGDGIVVGIQGQYAEPTNNSQCSIYILLIIIQKMDVDSQANNLKSLQNKIIKIQLTHKNDFKILWNFNGLLMPKIFRRHVFLSLSDLHTEIQKAQSALQNCYKSFKLGDLYTFGYSNTRKLSWSEKTKINQFSVPSPQFAEEEQPEDYFRSQIEALLKYRQPCFVVLFCGPKYNPQQIQASIVQFRQQHNLTCLFFLVSPFIAHTNLDLSVGIFRIREKQNIIPEFEQIYKFYNDRLACLWAEIVIESTNSDIFVQEKGWHSESFRSFRRRIYYPLAMNITDILETKQVSEKHNQWQFNLKLTYKLLSGEIYYSTKQIKIPLQQNIERYITYNSILDRKEEKKYVLSEGIALEGNPFFKVTRLKFGV